LFELLPAGSISGAPKEKTVEIIKQTETYKRGYYTGICGIFDGQNLDSGVMIRFIEKQGSQYYFKSGGGITVNSIAEEEYHEMIQKVYLPF
jgi:para-aminobenzoate synthetase component 1